MRCLMLMRHRRSVIPVQYVAVCIAVVEETPGCIVPAHYFFHVALVGHPPGMIDRHNNKTWAGQ